MPHQPDLAVLPASDPGPPEKHPDEALAESVSATSVSFVACGAAISDLGELLRDLRLALEVAGPRHATPERRKGAASLAARLESVRWALDGATAATRGLLEEACSADGGAPTGPSRQESRLQ